MKKEAMLESLKEAKILATKLVELVRCQCFQVQAEANNALKEIGAAIEELSYNRAFNALSGVSTARICMERIIGSANEKEDEIDMEASTQISKLGAQHKMLFGMIIDERDKSIAIQESIIKEAAACHAILVVQNIVLRHIISNDSDK